MKGINNRLEQNPVSENDEDDVFYKQKSARYCLAEA